MEFGIPPEHLFLDPIVMPLKFMQDQQIILARPTSSSFSPIRPARRCGLSNISNGRHPQKADQPHLAVMMAASGMDAVILE